jgi:hypothetical protein
MSDSGEQPSAPAEVVDIVDEDTAMTEAGTLDGGADSSSAMPGSDGPSLLRVTVSFVLRGGCRTLVF